MHVKFDRLAALAEEEEEAEADSIRPSPTALSSRRSPTFFARQKGDSRRVSFSELPRHLSPFLK